MSKFTNSIKHFVWSSTILRRATKLIYWTLTFQIFGKIKERLFPLTDYEKWIELNEPNSAELELMRSEQRSWQYRPKISLITPVFRPNENELEQCIESVLGQVYDNWELCIAYDSGEGDRVKQAIQKCSNIDKRIKCIKLQENKGIAGNSNEALKLASGKYIGLLDQDDVLAPFALYEVVKAINRDQTIDFLYSDQDKIDSRGLTRYQHYFKPEWSPDTLLSHNYICHFSVIRKILIDEVGGFRSEFDGSQDYDLFLRTTQRTSNIVRIPKVLYHWRAGPKSVARHPSRKVFAYESAQKALRACLDERDIDAEVHVAKNLYTFRVKYRVDNSQSVSIIIPTKDKISYLKRCVSSILSKTDYQHYEVLIVDNGSTEQETLDYYRSLECDHKIKILYYGDQKFNYSSINNYAVAQSHSDYLLFLNNDTEVIRSEWLSAMLQFAQRPDVGVVGAKLLYPDSRIQHAGVILGIGGVAGHSHKGVPGTYDGYAGRINIIQNLSAVTGACMMMRRSIFEEVNGFEEELAVSLNDIDLCMKIRERGYLIVYTPYAELFHHESISRGYDITPEQKERSAREAAFMKEKWDFDVPDPYYSPNLTLRTEDFSIRVDH